MLSSKPPLTKPPITSCDSRQNRRLGSSEKTPSCEISASTVQMPSSIAQSDRPSLLRRMICSASFKRRIKTWIARTTHACCGARDRSQADGEVQAAKRSKSVPLSSKIKHVSLPTSSRSCSSSPQVMNRGSRIKSRSRPAAKADHCPLSRARRLTKQLADVNVSSTRSALTCSRLRTSTPRPTKPRLLCRRSSTRPTIDGGQELRGCQDQGAPPHEGAGASDSARADV